MSNNINLSDLLQCWCLKFTGHLNLIQIPNLGTLKESATKYSFLKTKNLTYRLLPPRCFLSGLFSFLGSNVSEKVCFALRVKLLYFDISSANLILLSEYGVIISVNHLVAMSDIAEKMFSNWLLSPNWLSSTVILCLF